jgi:hypothetical protein
MADLLLENRGSSSCGCLRLSAGVHFKPLVLAAFELGAGLGKVAFDHGQDVIARRMPVACPRCTASAGAVCAVDTSEVTDKFEGDLEASSEANL